MTHQEIRDGNTLIKDFMGSTIKMEQEDVKDIPLAFLQLADLKFHLSWKWLMPVVIKIEEDEGHPIRIEGKTCSVTLSEDHLIEAEADSKLEAVWQAAVAYLEETG